MVILAAAMIQQSDCDGSAKCDRDLTEEPDVLNRDARFSGGIERVVAIMNTITCSTGIFVALTLPV